MKKIKKLIALVALVLSVVTVLGITASAEATFKDVKKSSWYYEAVTETVEKNIFTGTSDDKFSPNASMTRAMFVTTLARMNGVDVSEYTEVSFSDVKAGSWYAPYVEWAYKNSITDGIGNGKFGVNKTITRQEMVTLFYKNAAFMGESTEILDTFKYDKTFDINKIAEWAQDAMKWALSNSVISGTGNKGKELVVSPTKTATRAEAAQLIVNYLNFLKADQPAIGSLTINGNPISKYTIVHADNKDSKNAAKSLVDYINRATGVTLTYTTDSAPVGQYEILIGKTNREGNVVTVKREGTDRGAFEISVQGNYLVIAGLYDKYEANEYGVIGLALERLGFGFYSGSISTIDRVDSVDLEDGYFFADQPGFEYRVVYWGSKPEEERTGEPFNRKGLSHNLPEITGVPLDAGEPCLTDPEIIEHSINTVKGYLEKDPTIEIVYVVMNDRPDYCPCDRCMEVYREEGTRGATIMLLCDKIAKAIKEEYPNCYILTAAYLHTINPVKSKLDENVMVYYCPIENCASHDYSDSTCPLNASIKANMEQWNKVCDKLWIWDYSANFTYSFSAFPILESLRDNKEWLYNLGVVGEFNNAIMGRSGEFGNLVAYLLGKLQWDPVMSEEEYQGEIDAFLEAYYGAGWKNIRKYIDTMEILSEKNHWGYHVVPDGVIDYEDILKYMDVFEGYWDAAEAMAKDADELERVQRSRVSWTYTMLTALYTRDYCGEDYAAKEAYIALANEFFAETERLAVKWAESDRGKYLDPSRHPREWLPA